MQIIPGVLLPGNPMANMVFKAYSVQTLMEATMFMQDLKLGHYIKVPPHATFLGTLLSVICVCGVFLLTFVHPCSSINRSDISCICTGGCERVGVS